MEITNKKRGIAPLWCSSWWNNYREMIIAADASMITRRHSALIRIAVVLLLARIWLLHAFISMKPIHKINAVVSAPSMVATPSWFITRRSARTVTRTKMNSSTIIITILFLLPSPWWPTALPYILPKSIGEYQRAPMINETTAATNIAV